MAVVIASSLRKEIAGNLLFEGVSFKVERGDRLALSGPNGARQTTLLRMLSGETEGHGRGLGFGETDLDRPLDTFSGGELTRASLARALSGDPDLILLDEPTNHLDVENLEWLEQELQSLDAGVILVAHDRWFLEAVTTAVLELEAGRSLFFPGSWHVWRREKAARAAAAARTAERVGEDIARLERFVERVRY